MRAPSYMWPTPGTIGPTPRGHVIFSFHWRVDRDVSVTSPSSWARGCRNNSAEMAPLVVIRGIGVDLDSPPLKVYKRGQPPLEPFKPNRRHLYHWILAIVTPPAAWGALVGVEKSAHHQAGE